MDWAVISFPKTITKRIYEKYASDSEASRAVNTEKSVKMHLILFPTSKTMVPYLEMFVMKACTKHSTFLSILIQILAILLSEFSL